MLLHLFFLFNSSRHSGLYGNYLWPVGPDLSVLWQRPCGGGGAAVRGHGESSLIQTWGGISKKLQLFPLSITCQSFLHCCFYLIPINNELSERQNTVHIQIVTTEPQVGHFSFVCKKSKLLLIIKLTAICFFTLFNQNNKF